MPSLGRGEIRMAALTMIGMAILLQSTALIWYPRMPFHHELGSDFMAFYTAGTTLNRLPPAARLYDPELQQRLRTGIMPDADKATRLPYLYPPFIAAAMSPLARLPYRWAFAAWLAIGGVLTVRYGVDLAHRLPERALRLVFVGFTITVAIATLITARG